MTKTDLDFALSYAGEDSGIAEEISQRLSELGFSIFFAEAQRHLLVGLDGEKLFEELFSKSKQVIVFISKNYKRKEWTRLEWDIIKERELTNRFIPIRIDDTKIMGLPSNIFYIRFSGKNYDEITRACVTRLIQYERDQGIERPNEFEQMLSAIQNESKGALAKAFQLVNDQRKRDPLGDCALPNEDYEPCYEIINTELLNFSVVKRRAVKILVPPRLSQDELRFNLQHCAALQFNAFKPDAISVLAYSKNPDGVNVNGAFTAGKVDFAPFGQWGKAQDGVAYNIPVKEYDYSVKFAPDYFVK